MPTVRREGNDQIAWLGQGLSEGTSGRFCCPICNGGTTQEKSLSVTRENRSVVKYKCFRASCGQGGTIYLRGGPSAPPAPKLPRPYTKPTKLLSDEQVEFFRAKFGLDWEDLHQVRYTEETDRYICPILGPKQQERGVIARAFNGDTPKSITYKYKLDEPFLGWFLPNEPISTGVVVVEDWFSAAKVAKAGMMAVCLNGTSLNYDYACEIAEQGWTILALDKGTLPVMLKYVRLYSGLWERVQIWSLELDLKYEELERIVDAGKSGKAFVGRSTVEPKSV